MSEQIDVQQRCARWQGARVLVLVAVRGQQVGAVRRAINRDFPAVPQQTAQIVSPLADSSERLCAFRRWDRSHSLRQRKHEKAEYAALRQKAKSGISSAMVMSGHPAFLRAPGETNANQSPGMRCRSGQRSTSLRSQGAWIREPRSTRLITLLNENLHTLCGACGEFAPILHRGKVAVTCPRARLQRFENIGGGDGILNGQIYADAPIGDIA